MKKYQIKQSDYMLDGEIQLATSREAELVRMPMALISEAYLRNTFSRTVKWQNYIDGLTPSFIIEKPMDQERVRFLTLDMMGRAGSRS